MVVGCYAQQQLSYPQDLKGETQLLWEIRHWRAACSAAGIQSRDCILSGILPVVVLSSTHRGIRATSKRRSADAGRAPQSTMEQRYPVRMPRCIFVVAYVVAVRTLRCFLLRRACLQAVKKRDKSYLHSP